jgi:hypothetical protein
MNVRTWTSGEVEAPKVEEKEEQPKEVEKKVITKKSKK